VAPEMIPLVKKRVRAINIEAIRKSQCVKYINDSLVVKNIVQVSL